MHKSNVQFPTSKPPHSLITCLFHFEYEILLILTISEDYRFQNAFTHEEQLCTFHIHIYYVCSSFSLIACAVKFVATIFLTPTIEQTYSHGREFPCFSNASTDILAAALSMGLHLISPTAIKFLFGALNLPLSSALLFLS